MSTAGWQRSLWLTSGDHGRTTASGFCGSYTVVTDHSCAHYCEFQRIASIKMPSRTVWHPSGSRMRQRGAECGLLGGADWGWRAQVIGQPAPADVLLSVQSQPSRRARWMTVLLDRIMPATAMTRRTIVLVLLMNTLLTSLIRMANGGDTVDLLQRMAVRLAC